MTYRIPVKPYQKGKTKPRYQPPKRKPTKYYDPSGGDITDKVKQTYKKKTNSVNE